jgi:hypothetical protein
MLNGSTDGLRGCSLLKCKKTVMPSRSIPNPPLQSLSLLSIFLHPPSGAFSLSMWCTCFCSGRMTCGWWRCLLPFSSASVIGSNLELLQGERIQWARLFPKWIRPSFIMTSDTDSFMLYFPNRAPPQCAVASSSMDPGGQQCGCLRIFLRADGEVRLPPDLFSIPLTTRL